MSALEPDQVELRRAARERALELLYEAEIKSLDIDTLLAGLPLAPTELADELVRGVKAEQERIDALLARKVAPRWSLVRLATVDRAILRLASYELMCQPERSQAVILNEAVILARRFGTDDSPRFVNGVLAAVATEVRPDEGMAPLEPTVDGVVVDMDGVIRHWDAPTEAEAELALPEGAIAEAIWEPARLGRAMRGEISDEEWAAEIGAAVAQKHDVAADEVAKAFSENGWRIDTAVVELLEQVRERVPVVLLSNASTRLTADLQRSHILDSFDAVVNSAEIGVCKPEAEAYEAAGKRLGVGLDRCLFIDDTLANIEAAQAQGMQTHHFSDADELAAHLATLALIAT